MMITISDLKVRVPILFWRKWASVLSMMNDTERLRMRSKLNPMWGGTVGSASLWALILLKCRIHLLVFSLLFKSAEKHTKK